MANDTKTQLKVTPLANKSQYHLWQLRLKSHLVSLSEWDDEKKVPKDTPLVASLLISALSDNCLELVSNTTLDAPSIWTFFATLWVTSTLSSKATALNNLIQFNYPEASMIDNKTILLGLQRELVHATAVGSINTSLLPLRNVLCCHEIKQNLLSVSKLEDEGYDVLFSHGKVFIEKDVFRSTSKPVGVRQGASYYAHLPLKPECMAVSRAAFLNRRQAGQVLYISMNDWHRKFNHLNEKDLKKTLGNLSLENADQVKREKMSFCSDCAIGKATKGTVPKSSTFKSSRIGELIHTDTEYVNNSMLSYCSQHGILQQLTVPYHSHQNGLAERKHLTILNAVRAMLQASTLPETLWDEAVYYATFTQNVAVNHDDGKSPYEIWFGRNPSFLQLHEFGETCYSHIPKPLQVNKLGPRSQRCQFLGFSRKAKGLRLLTASGKFIEATHEDVLFPKDQPAMMNETWFNGDSKTTESVEPVIIEIGRTITAPETAPPNIEIPNVVNPVPSPGPNTLEPLPTASTAPSKAIDARPKHLKRRIDPPKTWVYNIQKPDYSSLLLPVTDMLSLCDVNWERMPPTQILSADVKEPLKYEDIEALADSDEWYKACDAEIASLIEHGTWELVPLPPDRDPIKCKWVFRIKRDSNGSIIKYKARLCACGYSQRKDIDYKDIYAPVVRAESLRIMLSIAAFRDMHLHQMDVVTAFLNGTLAEDIYMKQPPGYVSNNHPDHVCHLHRNLYGLKQAPRVWHQTIDPFLKSLGFKSLDADPCIYQQRIQDRLILLSLYVDDIAIAADSFDDLTKVKEALVQRFKMTDEGELQFILGIKIRRDRTSRKIYLSNKQYEVDMLTEFNMLTCNPVNTPLDRDLVAKFSTPQDGSSESCQMKDVPYREAVGKLTYLMRTTRPDLAYAVSLLNRFLHNPGLCHWSAVKRVLRYIKGSLDYELCLSSESGFKLTGYVDADWGGSQDCKSTTGYGFYLGQSLISWASKAQSTVATSSTHAEYIAAYHATAECLWLRSFLTSLSYASPCEATTIFCDNEPVVNISQFHMITAKNKHFETKFHFTREQTKLGNISLVQCAGKHNVADLFTKPLGKLKFEEFRQKLNLNSFHKHTEQKLTMGPHYKVLQPKSNGTTERFERSQNSCAAVEDKNVPKQPSQAELVHARSLANHTMRSPSNAPTNDQV